MTTWQIILFHTRSSLFLYCNHVLNKESDLNCERQIFTILNRPLQLPVPYREHFQPKSFPKRRIRGTSSVSDVLLSHYGYRLLHYRKVMSVNVQSLEGKASVYQWPFPAAAHEFPLSQFSHHHQGVLSGGFYFSLKKMLMENSIIVPAVIIPTNLQCLFYQN